MTFRGDDVARYYDRNTASFLAYGQGGASGAIHRAVWGEGVTSRDEAFHFVHELLRHEKASSVLDLGCGTGASLEYILKDTDATGFGVTNSSVHAELARERLGDRARILEADFCVAELPAVELAFGIESFVQAPDPSAFFANVARALSPGGRLVLCDDFLAGSADNRWVREFQRGWHASSLLVTREVDELAGRHGLELVEDRDLTPFLELDRPRDRMLRVVMALARPFASWNPRLLSHLGGNALRRCLKRGLVQYRYRVWRKR